MQHCHFRKIATVSHFRLVCKKNDSKTEAIVHQNDLYGNVTNEDYFNERYVTNIVDTNQYYDDEYQA